MSESQFIVLSDTYNILGTIRSSVEFARRDFTTQASVSILLFIFGTALCIVINAFLLAAMICIFSLIALYTIFMCPRVKGTVMFDFRHEVDINIHKTMWKTTIVLLGNETIKGREEEKFTRKITICNRRGKIHEQTTVMRHIGGKLYDLDGTEFMLHEIGILDEHKGVPKQIITECRDAITNKNK